MALKIRLARGGRKKLAHYAIVVADSRAPRDGKYLEKVGTYSPVLPATHEKRLVLNADRIQHWMKLGALPTDRVAIFLGQAGLAPKPSYNETPKRSAPKAKAQERMREQAERAEKLKAAEEAAKAEAAKPKEEASAEAEATAAETTAE